MRLEVDVVEMCPYNKSMPKKPSKQLNSVSGANAAVGVFSYFNYREYLRDYCEQRKQADPYFSMRNLARRVGMDHGYFIKVMQEHKHLAPKMAAKFSATLKHSKKEKEYFELLILFGRAKGDREIKHYFEQLLKYVEFSPLKLDADCYEFYQKWFYTAIRELLNILPAEKDHAKLAKKLLPAIKATEAKQAIALLKRLGLIKVKDGRYQLTQKFISSDKIPPISVREFQKQTMDLAKDALTNIAKEERDISTLSLTLSEDGLERIKEILETARTEIMKAASQDSKVNRIYQLNLQLFPISQVIEEAGDE